MINNILTVRQVVLVRQYKNIGITSKLNGFHIPSRQSLTPRFYNGRIAWQYKNVRVGLTTLRKQPHCRINLIIEENVLPF